MKNNSRISLILLVTICTVIAGPVFAAAPVSSDQSITISSSATITISAADFAFSDPDSGDMLDSVTIIRRPEFGELFLDLNDNGDNNSETLINGAAVSRADLDLNRLKYTPAPDLGSSFDFTFSDGTQSSAEASLLLPYRSAQIGSGVSVSSGNTFTPFTTFFEDSRDQFLITADDFKKAGVSPGDTLYSLAFDVVAAVSVLNNVTIRVKQTTDTSFAVFSFDETGLSTVFTGAQQTTLGLNQFFFTTPFVYSGDSVLVDFSFNNEIFVGNSTVRFSTTAFTSHRYAYTDDSDGATLSSFGSNSNRANMQFRTVPLVQPDIPTVDFGPPIICDGNAALLTWSGDLNEATEWRVYSGSCGGTLVSNSGTFFSDIVGPHSTSPITYFVRGEGGSITPGMCGSVTITPTPQENSDFNYSASNYFTIDPDPAPTITGVGGGTFARVSGPTGLVIDTGTGVIDLSASPVGDYLISYTTPSICAGVSTVSVTIEEDPLRSVDLSVTTNSGAEAAATSITLTATASGLVDGNQTINIAVGGAGITGADYVLSNSTITILDGQTIGTATFTIQDDALFEGTETATLMLNAPSAGLVLGSTPSQSITISDNDSAAVTIADVSANEDDGGILVTATLDNAVQGGFTVDVSTADGSATTADGDYSAVAGQTLTFTGNAGETRTFTVTPINDSKLEANEVLSISQSNLAATSLGVVITDGATVTIDNDDAAAVSIADVSANEDDGGILVTATLDNAVQGGFSVDVSTADGSATTADGDYSAVTGQTLTFTGNAGETRTFTVTPTVDTQVEPDETLSVSQSNLAVTSLGVVITDDATITLRNDDSAAVTIANVDGNENDGAITVTATLNNAVAGGFTVNANTADGSATTADSDYQAVIDQTLTFAGNAGETRTFTVTPIADTTLEANETIIVSLAGLADNSASVTISDTGTVTINNDDAAVVTIDDVSSNENDGAIIVTATLDNAVQGGFTVDVDSSDESATLADGDYTALVGQTLTFVGDAGETQTFTVLPTADDIVEPDETLTVAQGNLAVTDLAVVIADGATVTIANDDTASLSITETAAAAEDDTDGVFTVTTTNWFADDVTIGITVSGDATQGVDYSSIGTSVVFPANQDSLTIPVEVISDTILEANETVTVSMTGTDNTDVTIAANDTASMTITDNDSATLSIVATTQAVESGTNGVFTISTTAQLSSATTVTFSIAGNATAGADYSAFGSMFTFPALADSTTIVVPVLADNLVEGNESVIVSLLSTNNGDLSIGTTSSAEIIISDGDAAELNITTTAQAIEGERDGVFTITSSSLLAEPATLDISFGGSATEGVDYTSIGTSIQFPANRLSTTINVSPIIDVLDEADETVVMSITGSNAPGVTIGNQDSATVTIANRLPALSIQLDTNSVAENAGVNSVTGAVMRNDVALTEPLTINLSSSDTSKAVVPATVTIEAGQAAAAFFIAAIDNAVEDPDQVVIITASATDLVDGTASLNVINDDFDRDGDGFLDDFDNCPNAPNPSQADFEGDGIGDACDLDRDGDGLPDAYEIANGLNPLNSLDRDADPDGDGFTNIDEFNFGTNPQVADDDLNDNGVPDIAEARNEIIVPVLQLLLSDE